jgi:hypothetical protein
MQVSGHLTISWMAASSPARAAGTVKHNSQSSPPVKGQLPRCGFIGEGKQIAGQQQPFRIDAHAAVTGHTQTQGIGSQAIGYVDAGGGDSRQRASKRDAGRRIQEAPFQCLPVCSRKSTGARVSLQQPQSCGGIPRRAADIEQVARTGTGTPQRRARRHRAQRLHHSDQGSAGGVAADQGHAVLVSQLEKTTGKLRQELLVGSWQREGEQEPGRLGTHGGQIGKIHGQGPVADRGRGHAGGKMPAFHQRIEGGDQLHSRRRRQQCGVVADAQWHIPAPRALRRGATAEIAVDQLELTQRHQCSSGRSMRAALSITALTNLCPSVAPKRRARPTASLMATRNGTSG